MIDSIDSETCSEPILTLLTNIRHLNLTLATTLSTLLFSIERLRQRFAVPTAGSANALAPATPALTPTVQAVNTSTTLSASCQLSTVNCLASITSNTDLGNSLSLNQITSHGRLLAFNPALSRFNRSEMAKIKFLQPDL